MIVKSLSGDRVTTRGGGETRPGRASLGICGLTSVAWLAALGLADSLAVSISLTALWAVVVLTCTIWSAVMWLDRRTMRRRELDAMTEPTRPLPVVGPTGRRAVGAIPFEDLTKAHAKASMDAFAAGAFAQIRRDQLQLQPPAVAHDNCEEP